MSLARDDARSERSHSQARSDLGGESLSCDGGPRPKRQRTEKSGANTHYKARFHSVFAVPSANKQGPGAGAAGQGAAATNGGQDHDAKRVLVENLFCAFPYIVATPSSGTTGKKMHSFAEGAVKGAVAELNLSNSESEQVDAFNYSLMLHAGAPGPFSRRKYVWDPKPLPVTHPLGVNKRYTKEQQKQRLVNKQQETEALFLRRPILVQNDIFTKGDDIVVGAEAAEKNLPRKPEEEQTPQQILDRVLATFTDVKKTAVHPYLNVKVKKELELLPDAKLWPTSFRSVIFDEETQIAESEDNPAVFWGETKLGKSYFGLLKPDAGGEHRLERAYIWSNKGAWEAAREEQSTMLLQFGDSKTKKVRFCPISNKMRMKKMLAQLQTGINTDFDVGRKHVEWRAASAAEENQDHKKGLIFCEPDAPSVKANGRAH
eukprot:g4851.t1